LIACQSRIAVIEVRVAPPNHGRVPVDLAGDALVLDVLLGAAVAVGDPGEGVGRDRDRVAATQEVDQRPGGPRDQLHRGAAVLLAAGVVGDEVDVEVVGRLEQQLATQQVVVLVVVLVLGARALPGHHVHPPVALALGGIDAERGIVAERVVVGAGHAERAVVARGDLALDPLGVARATGHHVDHAGRGVLAEHRALRALEHLDPLDLAEVAEADAVARPVHAVDHHAHRRLQPGVVADGADAADARGRDRLVLGAGHGQAGHQDLQVLDVADAGVLHLLPVQHGHRDRHVLQRFLALLRGDGDGGERDRLLLLLACDGFDLLFLR
jgi:hypothetical protein